MKILENIDINKINISMIENVIRQQNNCLLEMYKLLLFDEQQPNKSNNKVAKAFLETQLKALEHLNNILDKHKEQLQEKKDEHKKVKEDTEKAKVIAKKEDTGDNQATLF